MSPRELVSAPAICRERLLSDLEKCGCILSLMSTTTSNPDYQLEHVSDADLLASARRLVGRSNQLLAALLAHLAEVEARGLHRLRACASLYTYCV
jgi:hypothetical protein